MNNVFAFMEDYMPILGPTQEQIADDAVSLVNRARRLVRDLEDLPRRHGAVEVRRPGSLGRLVGALLEDMRQDLEHNVFITNDNVSQEIHDLVWLIDCAQTVGELTHTCYALISKVQVFAMYHSQINVSRLTDFSHYDPQETS